ncbi:MAG: hypothetical protein ACXVP0_05310, partial [Bacteroidia bacterium]
KRSLILILLLTANTRFYSQCCTSGCCAPGTANFGVLEKGDLLFFSFFKRNYSDKYYQGDRPTNFSYLINDYADYAGVNFSYGITDRLTTQVSLGYFTAKVENFDVPLIGQQQIYAQGLADPEVFLKYNFFNSKNKVFSLTGSAGARLPAGPYKLSTGNVQLPRDVQPGTGACSGIFILYAQLKPFKNKSFSFLLNSRTDYNGSNSQGFRYGTANTNSIGSVIPLNKEFSLIVMVRNENKDCDRIHNVGMFSSASYRFFASPGISLNLKKSLSFSFYGDIPVYQNYAGTQLASKYALSISVSKVFEFHKEHPEAQ